MLVAAWALTLTRATTLADLSTQMATLKETHHFYAVLFYFRFPETFYSVTQMALVALDTVTLIKTALDNERYALLKASVSLRQLSSSALKLVTTLHETWWLRDLAKALAKAVGSLPSPVTTPRQ